MKFAENILHQPNLNISFTLPWNLTQLFGYNEVHPNYLITVLFSKNYHFCEENNPKYQGHKCCKSLRQNKRKWKNVWKERRKKTKMQHN